MTTVTKRDGRAEAVSFDKILRRIKSLCQGLPAVDDVRVAKRVVQGVSEGVKTSALDELAAETAAALAATHPQYSVLAGRVSISNLHKMTRPTIAAIAAHLAEDVRAFVGEHVAAIDAEIVWERDYDFDYFGFKTLERSYLLRVDGVVIERPQIMMMRVALGIHCGSLEDVFTTYHLLSQRAFTHATPTMFNAGTKFPHLASCFLLPVVGDSIEDIFETQKRCALISKSAGGIGFSVSNVRAQGSRIHSTGGTSSGLVPMLRCFEATARYVDQGGGKRKGAFAAYLEPWHADVRVFLDMKKNHGVEEMRARDLFYALWIPDIFMRRVETDAAWTLLCPSQCADLVDLHGAAFDARYEEYENDVKISRTTLRAQEIWFAILDAQIETGTPFMLYKDACNAKSNQKHLGTIRSSNLCTEIVQFSSADEIAVCNLASISLPYCVADGRFDFDALSRITRTITKNLNKVIDRNLYAREEARMSNLKHRPVGIGVQGLADVFALLDLPFDSAGAAELNRNLFETIYFAALDASCDLARLCGAHSSFEGSPASQGLLQFDLWNVDVGDARHDWSALKRRIAQFGLRNSLLVAPMPTASTAQILGNNECFEPFTSNIYVRRVLAGEFAVINKHLVRRLESVGLWNEAVRLAIIAGNGSIQHIPEVPDNLKALFKTAWELSMRTLIDLAADRAPFVDQSQSLNLFMAAPTHSKLSSMHFHAWKRGLKTGMYYLRTKPAADPVKVTVPVECLSCSA
jgi:ribonucleoside-diphosphate reductase alpha subunit